MEAWMATITVPVARVKQGDLILYVTSIKVKDLTADKFYSVETLDPENTSDTGYQRLLNRYDRSPVDRSGHSPWELISTKILAVPASNLRRSRLAKWWRKAIGQDLRPWRVLDS
jgi:hypothetical protein